MNERFSPLGERQTDNENANKWDMSDVGEFNPEAARARIEEERQEWLDPEKMKNIEALTEQLEQMGLNEEIAKNKAFHRELDRIVDRCDLKIANMVDSEGVKKSDFGNGFRLECDIRDDRDVQRKSVYAFRVAPDGNLSISSAVAQLNSNLLRDHAQYFQDYDGLVNSNGQISTLETENNSWVTSFEMSKDGQEMIMNELHLSDWQLRPLRTMRGGDQNKMQEFIYHSELTRRFDQDGVEQSRTDVGYVPFEREWSRDMEYSTELEGAAVMRVPDWMGREVKKREYCERVSDTKMNTIYREKGEKLEVRDEDIDSEHGTDELISTVRLADLLDARDQQGVNRFRVDEHGGLVPDTDSL